MDYRCEGHTSDGQLIKRFVLTAKGSAAKALAMFRQVCRDEGRKLVSARAYVKGCRKVLAQWEADD